ncbi:MAG: transcription antitermination factor NusB, partial [Bacteroidota bacterium]
MLSRRQLRVKVLQGLYAYFQSDKRDLAAAERELFRSIEKVHELYIYLLRFLLETADAEESDEKELQHKYFPDQEELDAKRRFYRSPFIIALKSSSEFELYCRRYSISWQKDHELVRKLFVELKRSATYRAYITTETIDESVFIAELIKTYLDESEPMSHHIEEENIFWTEDFSFVSHMVARTVRQFFEKSRFELFGPYRDEKDDKDFVKTLFSKTIVHNKEYEAAVSERTKNWDLERIAMMDILLLKMALAELVHFSGIPVKVSINEYIEISKDFSTPKSKQFINGIIDKL